ncbi:EamA family transporter, partial [Klebsiella pneumoniae]|uniref:EamA family transporter n=1 Tax=Klebsiella pneumoniae TaxID=573 RepID=UPI00200E2829
MGLQALAGLCSLLPWMLLAWLAEPLARGQAQPALLALVLLAVLASFTFSVMNALVKEASATLPAAEIVFFRSAIGTLLIYLLMRQAGVALSRQGVPMLLVRGVMGALYLVCYFYAIAHIPLADASILAHMSPFFVIL